jgi:replicative DNA helicase
VSKTKNPIQPLAKDARGALRFKANAIVQHLLDSHQSCDMNTLASMDFTDDDRQQFAQLIGYSLSGYGELQRYVDDEAYDTAAHMAEGLDERDARIAALQQKLSDLRASVDAMREPMARLLEMHPDDLKAAT